MRRAHNWSQSVDAIVKRRVPCLSVPTLLTRHGVAKESMRVLTVDAESLDVEIVESLLPLHRFPNLKLIMWETNINLPRHDDARHARLRALVKSVEGHGFQCRGWGSRRQRAPLNSRCILDEENAWCIHESVANQSECDASAVRRCGKKS